MGNPQSRGVTLYGTRFEAGFLQQIAQRICRKMSAMKRYVPVDPVSSEDTSQPAPAVRAADPHLAAWPEKSVNMRHHLSRFQRMLQHVGKDHNIIKFRRLIILYKLH